MILDRPNMKDIGVMIIDLEGENCTIGVVNWLRNVNSIMGRKAKSIFFMKEGETI